jgi:hypothetical protein
MDYALHAALRAQTPSDWVDIIYNIVCEWHKNLGTRCASFPAELKSRLEELAKRYFIPKFHITAHGAACQTAFLLNWRWGVGRTFGEMVEQEWAHIKKCAASTREQGPGARHLTLDDQWAGWNWRRTVGLGLCFASRRDLSTHTL